MATHVAALHDLSGVGRCSLTAVIPVLSAMGITVYPLPTAVLSNQTEFDRFACRSLTPEMSAFMQQWQVMGLQFDGISIGFLNDREQVAVAHDFLDRFHRPQTLFLLDPVMGDDGVLYPVYNRLMVEAMRSLAVRADILTPNLTEACLLCEEDYRKMQSADEKTLHTLMRTLSAMGPRIVLLTGIHRGNAIESFCYTAENDAVFSLSNERIGGHFSGTGDLFAAVLLGGFVLHRAPQEILSCAVSFLEASIRDTVQEGSDPREGILFESHLDRLISFARGVS